MESTKKQYWKGLEELSKDPEFVKHADKEFSEYLPTNSELEETEAGSTRRDFLKLMGFGMAAVTLASCEAPIRKAIPYVNKPVDVDPGVANYYATTYNQGGDYASIVVKTREGRPIKIEGNKLSKITQGGTNAQIEASVLSLYDKERLAQPLKGGEATDWETLDAEVAAKLTDIAAKGGHIRLVSNTIMSPTALKAIEEFKAKFGNVELVQYDTQSAYGLSKAHKDIYGVAGVPSYHFDKADVIVSFDADFLGSWISPIEYSKGYAKTRKLGPKKKTMSRHYHFESNLSLTGANADYRTPIKPSEQGSAVVALYNEVAAKTGGTSVSGGGDFANVKKAAADLVKAKGKSLVVSGSNDPAIQTLIASINMALANFEKTITLNDYSNARKGDDAQMSNFMADAKAGRLDAVVFLSCNPVYNHSKGAELAESLKKVALTVSTSDRNDETASLVNYVAPNNHFLESWSDSEPKNGTFSLGQPTISPIFKTRQEQESLLSWAGNTTSYFDYLKNNWKENFSEGKEGLAFQSFWDKCLQDGIYETSKENFEINYTMSDDNQAAATIANNYKGDGFELALYQKVAIGDGSQANNPWLQETPDPITKGTWDNYVTVSLSDAKALGITEYEGKSIKVELTVNGASHKLPVVIQPGQAKGTLGLALGYGRKNGGKVANNLGFDANPLVGTLNGGAYFSVTTGVNLVATDEAYQVARTQTHQTYMDRGNIIQEASLKEYQKDPMAGREVPMIATWQDQEHGKVKATTLSLWKGHEYPDHHWGLAIDLNSCTGCSACHVACVAENNIPVVGRQEVINRRDMHWMRIDRYYSSNEEELAKTDGLVDRLAALDIASENPEVTFQPMMCQHCNNAGCETVCPVAATTHSTSGLNQMVYNRCIGTRYCANNCAYKVRRFNWFKYHDNEQFDMNSSMNNDLGKMVLNPDVTVRSRGVMEKCSMCVQRIQSGKLEAKKEDRRTNDADITTACASACPSDAIVFGDMNDDNSQLSQLLRIKNEEGDYGIDKQVNEERAYAVLEETGSKPNVLYLTKIRNTDKKESHA